MQSSRRQFLRLAGAAGAASTLALPGAAQSDYRLIQVPRDEPTIQRAVDAARPGDIVGVTEGVYRESVKVTTPRITIRGVDRNAVVLDGQYEGTHGVYVEADGVAVENLTVRHFQANAVYWSHTEGFRASYVTAYNNGNYGVYAYESRDGRFEACYASGHPDAGIYLGRRNPFDALVTGCTAEYNAWGYSGTSAGGNLTVRDSTFRHNMAGIVPNTLDTSDPPQRGTRIEDNTVVANDNRNAPTKQFTYPGLGTGILLWGANDNVVVGNDVRDHERFGIALAEHVVPPSGNLVQGNTVGGSGAADLALGSPSGGGNRFVGNVYGTSLPPTIQTPPTRGSAWVSQVFADLVEEAKRRDSLGGDWWKQPAPGDRPTMPNPDRPPEPASRDASVVEE